MLGILLGRVDELSNSDGLGTGVDNEYFSMTDDVFVLKEMLNINTFRHMHKELVT